MAQFSVAVCDDEKSSREYQKMLVCQWAEKIGINVTVDLYTSAENFIFEAEEKKDYDLLLLDIQMGNMNGVELARLLRKKGFAGSLIFLTGVRDYAIEGYEVGAVRYLLKPIKEPVFFNVLDLVYSDFSRRGTEVFVFQQSGEVQKIPFENIVYIEARGHYLHLCCKDCEKEWKGTFSSISENFEKKGFFCLRRGFLVNMQHVEKFTRTECILSNGEIIPVARNKYMELNEAFINYYRN